MSAAPDDAARAARYARAMDLVERLSRAPTFESVTEVYETKTEQYRRGVTEGLRLIAGMALEVLNG